MVERKVKVTITGHYTIKEQGIKNGTYGPGAAELLGAGKVDEAFEQAIEMDRNAIEAGEYSPEELFDWNLENGATLGWAQD